jgi:hypothetical protein
VQSSLFLPVSCCFFIHALLVVTCFPHTYEEALRFDEINCSTNIEGVKNTLVSCLSHNRVFLCPFWGHIDYNITILMLNRTNFFILFCMFLIVLANSDSKIASKQVFFKCPILKSYCWLVFQITNSILLLLIWFWSLLYCLRKLRF